MWRGMHFILLSSWFTHGEQPMLRPVDCWCQRSVNLLMALFKDGHARIKSQDCDEINLFSPIWAEESTLKEVGETP
jgi:hypothetical protein